MSYWDKVSGIYDLTESINGKVYREMLKMTARLTPRGAKVLDCAAGTGELSFAAAKKARSVLCTDFSEKMLARAEKKASSRGITNISFEKRSIYELPDEDETYDVVIAGNVLHLLDDPQKAAKELFRVTKRGGIMLLPCFTDLKKNKFIKVYKLFGFDPAQEFTSEGYVGILAELRLGKVRAKLLKGFIPCTYAAVYKR